MAAYQTQQINVGSIQAPDVGKVFTDYAGILNQNYQQGLDRAREANNMAMQQARYAREQELNKRADQEWNREIGLRDARKNIAAEFAANPYAAKFGSGKETVDLDKQVLDYVNNGGEINEDLAKRLQARYEEALPFREDATNAIASRMIALGEDPTKAKQEAEVLASGQLLSKADKQARLDAQQQMAQKYYDEWAKANLEAAKMNIDIGKANLNADTDLTKLKWQAGMGGTGSGGSTGTTGGIGGNWYDAQQAVEKMDFGGIDTRTVAKPFLETAQALGYSPNQAVLALKQGADLGLIDKTFDVEKSKAFLQKMAPIQTGTGGTRLDMAVSGTQFMPQFAPKQIAGYDPKGFLEGSRSVLPELFKGDPNKVTEETKVNNPVTSTNTRGNTLADRNFNPGNIKFDPNTKWEGGSKGEKGFVKFDTPELGARALAKVITNNIGTPVNAFITKYAPPYENDTTSYIANAVKAIGKKPTDAIGEKDILPLMKVISRVEGGSFTEDQLKAGYDMINKKSSGGIAKTDKVLVDIFGKPSADGLVEAISNAPTKNEQLNLIRSNYDSDASTQELESILQKVKATPKVDNEKQPISLAAFSATKLTPEDVKERELIFDTKGAAAANEFVKSRYDLGKDYANMYKAGFSSDEMKHYGALKREGHVKAANNYYSAIYEKRNQLDGYTSSSPISIKSILPDWKTDSTVVSDQDTQKQRAAVIAKRYQLNPGLLSPEELRWIQDSKMTVNGRKQLSELGIK